MLSNEINNELSGRNEINTGSSEKNENDIGLSERNQSNYSVDLYQTSENEITIRGNGISQYNDEINNEFKKYGNSKVHVIDINSILIEYTNAADAQRAIQSRNEILYAIKKNLIN
jgi:hypothetical protein